MTDRINGLNQLKTYLQEELEAGGESGNEGDDAWVAAHRALNSSGIVSSIEYDYDVFTKTLADRNEIIDILRKDNQLFKDTLAHSNAALRAKDKRISELEARINNMTPPKVCYKCSPLGLEYEGDDCPKGHGSRHE